MIIKRAFLKCADTLCEWNGQIFWIVVLLLTLLVTTDVMLRYVFNSPIIWGMDIAVMLAGTLTMMGLGYTLLHGGHIGVDVIEQKLSPRAKAILALVTFPLFFIAVGSLLWVAVPEAIHSVAIRENYPSYTLPPVYPYRILMVWGFFLLFIQGIAKFIRNIDVARGAAAVEEAEMAKSAIDEELEMAREATKGEEL